MNFRCCLQRVHFACSVEEDKSYNGILDTLKTRVKLTYNGDVEWNSPIMFRISCSINVAKFPFDTQKCEFKFGSFTYDSTKLELIPESNKADLTQLTGTYLTLSGGNFYQSTVKLMINIRSKV